MTQFAIAGLQLDATAKDNLAEISKQVAITKAQFPWVKMIVLSELLAFGADVSRAETLPGPTEDYFCSLARKHDVWLVNGSVYELDGERVYNTTSVINPDGDIVVRHRKLYPFLPYEKGIASGDQHTVFTVDGVGTFGVSICYDMWFPETTRALVALGAEVILHPTLTNTMDRDAELTLARANAITNQCYFVDINAGGQLAYGQSIVIGPEGDVIHQAGRHTEIIPVLIDFERVRRTREEGIHRLGQPLKSFRDGDVKYPQYDPEFRFMPHLGALKMPD